MVKIGKSGRRKKKPRRNARRASQEKKGSNNMRRLLLPILCIAPAFRILDYKKHMDKYDLAIANRKSIADKLVDAEIVDIEFITDDDGKTTRWLHYEHLAPDGYICEKKVISPIQRHIGETDQMMLLFENDEYFLEELRALPSRPSLEQLISDVVTLAAYMAIIWFLTRSTQ
jgi:hypothetical protein